MSNRQVPQQAKTVTEDDDFPVAAIVCIAIGAYVVLIAVILLIRQILLKRGICSEGCSVCGKEAQLGCCECCIQCSETCNCCENRSIESCLDSICPARRQMDCADIIMCKCCTDQTSDCCSSEEPLCDCAGCACDCKPDCDCESIDCCCFEISLKGGGGQGGMDQQYPQYPQYPPGSGVPIGGTMGSMGAQGYGMGYPGHAQPGMGGTVISPRDGNMGGMAGGTSGFGGTLGGTSGTAANVTNPWGGGGSIGPPSSSARISRDERFSPTTTQPGRSGAPY